MLESDGQIPAQAGVDPVSQLALGIADPAGPGLVPAGGMQDGACQHGRVRLGQGHDGGADSLCPGSGVVAEPAEAHQGLQAAQPGQDRGKCPSPVSSR